jgi:hypothetical protein
MRSFCGFVLSILVLGRVLVSAQLCAAESASSNPVTNIVILRGAERLESPHVVSYRMVEWEQMRGRWILPDIGYYDSGYGANQLWLAGGGADLVQHKRFLWEQEVYFAQAAGQGAHNERSLLLWQVLEFNFKHKISGQAVEYPTLPLDRAQRWEFNVDRAKLERTLGERWKAGIGYAGGIGTDRTWQNMPFGTVTRKTRAGSFEFWLEKVPGGSQVQMRYQLVHKGGE